MCSILLENNADYYVGHQIELQSRQAAAGGRQAAIRGRRPAGRLPLGPDGPHMGLLTPWDHRPPGPMKVYGLPFCRPDYVGSTGLFGTIT